MKLSNLAISLSVVTAANMYDTALQALCMKYSLLLPTCSGSECKMLLNIHKDGCSSQIADAANSDPGFLLPISHGAHCITAIVKEIPENLKSKYFLLLLAKIYPAEIDSLPNDLQDMAHGDYPLLQSDRIILAFIDSFDFWKGKVYDPQNPFYRLVHNTLPFSTVRYTDDPNAVNNNNPLFSDDCTTIAFGDLHKLSKIHSLIIPKECYTNLTHLFAHGKDSIFIDLIRRIPHVARLSGIDQSGYRVASNAIGSSDCNFAQQTVFHLHIHVAGGECLGAISKASDNVIPLRKDTIIGRGNVTEMEISFNFVNQKESLRRICVSTHEPMNGIPKIIMIQLLDPLSGKSVYPNFHEFAVNADDLEIIALKNAIVRAGKVVDFFENGWRLVAGSGRNAHELSGEGMKLLMIGGVILDPPVTKSPGREALCPNHLFT